VDLETKAAQARDFTAENRIGVLQTRVDFVELQGTGRLLTLSLGGCRLCALATVDRMIAGQELMVKIRWSRVLVFERVTGALLSAGRVATGDG
jgi:hypothetical protein